LSEPVDGAASVDEDGTASTDIDGAATRTARRRPTT